MPEMDEAVMRSWKGIVLVSAVFLISSCVSRSKAIQLQGPSMEPSYPDGTTLRIEEIDVSILERGDLVYFQLPINSNFYVKRVIGLPGEAIHIESRQIQINGVPLVEPYPIISDESEEGSYTLGQGQYFVLGDNRPDSLDSINFGPIQASDILGRATPIR